MKKLLVSILPAFLLIGLALLLFFITKQSNFAVLSPVGFIGENEKNLIVLAVSLMLLLALPVVGAVFFIAWKYRAGSTKAKYSPEWTGNIFIKSLWWGILAVYVVIFFVIVWVSAHKLDPYKPIESANKPITIDVVALQWKWLFIYPEQNIATINFIQIPVHTPVNFQLTADAPMNSFWIPNLGGQIYAMATMETKLHLISDKIGDFPGGAAEISGSGFAGMRFTTRVSSQADFNAWVEKVKKSSKALNRSVYNILAKPSEDTPVTFYAPVEKDLFDEILEKYMIPTAKPGQKTIIPIHGMSH